jgi:hypothetical protein
MSTANEAMVVPCADSAVVGRDRIYDWCAYRAPLEGDRTDHASASLVQGWILQSGFV